MLDLVITFLAAAALLALFWPRSGWLAQLRKSKRITERVLIATLVAFGQVLLVPLVALPRLVMEWPRVVRGGGDAVYLAELISSMVLAVAVGLGLAALY